MNRDQVEGTMGKAKGSVKETVGKVVGSEKLRTEGQIDKAAGTVQKKVGDAREAVKDAVNKSTKP